jgi:ssDNA-binding replication factor A large subunit
MKMDYSLSSEGILKKVLGYGYQIEPAALNILESLGEEKVIEVLDSFTDKFPDTIVIEGKQIEAILEKTASKEAAETNKFALCGKITQIYDGSGLIQRCPKCNRWIIDNFCMVHSDVEGIWDLRIKARFDAGNGRRTLIFKKDIAEKSANITLEEAKKLGEAETLARIKEALVNRNIKVGGIELNGGYFLVKAISEV